MKRFLLIALTTSALAASLPAQAGARIYVRIGPPVPVVEVAAVAPGPGYVWVPGYHRWDGGAYVWVGGHWAVPPHHYYHAWVPGHWVRHSRHGWYWREGHWRR